MTAVSPTFAQIKAQVHAIRKRTNGSPRVFGIHSEAPWTGDRTLTDGRETYAIVQCDSALHFREALRAPDEDDSAKVLVTGLRDQDLGEDVLVRLAKRRLHAIDRWEIVKTLFRARHADPRIVGEAWIADRLLELAPPEGYAPVLGGLLDAETVWGILFRQVGLDTARPDLWTLLQWASDPRKAQAFQESPESFRQGATEWLRQSVGEPAVCVVRCVENGTGPDAVPIGLALEVLFSPEAHDSLQKAIGRVEEAVGVKLDAALADRWRRAAREVVQAPTADSQTRRCQLARADAILRSYEAEEYAHLSDASPLGLDQRLARFGKALASAVSGHLETVPDAVTDAYERVRSHLQAAEGTRQVQRATMAVRLVRWLAEDRSAIAEAASFPDAALGYAQGSGFVDWAREVVSGPEPVGELAEA